MKSLDVPVTLISKQRFDHDTASRLGNWPFGSRFARSLSRRTDSPAIARADEYLQLPLSQWIHPLAGRLHFRMNASMERWITRTYQNRVYSAVPGTTLLHSIEGLALRALEDNRPDVVVVERRSFHQDVVVPTALLVDDFPNVQRRDPLAAVFDREIALADALVVYASAVKDSFIAAGVPADKIHVIPLPSRTGGTRPARDETALARDPNRLLYVGRGDSGRGLDLAVAVAKALGPPFRLRVAGPMTKQVLTWLRSRSSYVDYLGILGRAELHAEYAAATLLLAPSIESYGLAVSEAIEHGLPTLCLPTTGISEYISGPLIHLVPERSVDAWVSAVREFDPNRAEPTTWAPGLSFASVTRELTTLYQDLGA